MKLKECYTYQFILPYQELIVQLFFSCDKWERTEENESPINIEHRMAKRKKEDISSFI